MSRTSGSMPGPGRYRAAGCARRQADGRRLEPVLHQVPQAAWWSACSAAPATGLWFLTRSRSPATTLSKIDIVGNGFGRWKTIPTRLRTVRAGCRGRRRRIADLDPPTFPAVVVQTVDGRRIGRLPAPRRSHQGRHLVPDQIEGDVAHHPVAPKVTLTSSSDTAAPPRLNGRPGARRRGSTAVTEPAG